MAVERDRVLSGAGGRRWLTAAVAVIVAISGRTLAVLLNMRGTDRLSARYLTAQPASRPGTDDFRAAVASEALATGHRRRGHAGAAARDRHVPLASTVRRRPETMGVLIMRKLIATVFNYSLDGLLADEGTEFWKFCFDLPENREPDDPAQLDFLQSAYAHIMGRTAYEAIAGP
jgi:hypothetical protein